MSFLENQDLFEALEYLFVQSFAGTPPQCCFCALAILSGDWHHQVLASNFIIQGLDGDCEVWHLILILSDSAELQYGRWSTIHLVCAFHNPKLR